MRRVSKVAVALFVVSLNVAPSFAAEVVKRAPKKVNPIVALLRQFAARVFDGGDMSMPRP